MDLTGKPGILKEINSLMIERSIYKYGTLNSAIATYNKMYSSERKRTQKVA